MSYRLAKAILTGSWLIHPATVHGYLPLVGNVVRGDQLAFPRISDEQKEGYMPFTISAAAESTPGQPATGERLIRVIPVIGEMLKYTEDCGPIGMVDIARSVQMAADDSKIDAIVLKLDSPGGQVDGTQTFADTIINARKSKPVIGFIDDGMCCSGNYWIGSSCDELIASQKTDWIGSIGVFVTLADIKAYWESQGLPIHQIYATQSSEKNKIVIDALANDYEPIRKELLNPIAQTFISAVKKNRSGKINLEEGDPFKGRAYMATDALKIGLIDKIGTFNYALQRAADMSRGRVSETAINSTPNTMKKALVSLLVFAGIMKASASEAESPEATEQDIIQLREKFETAQTDLSNAKDANAKLEKDLKEANDKLTASEQKVSDLNAEVARLGTQPGEKPTSAKKQGTDNIESSSDGLVDPEAEHNKTAAKAEL